MNARLVTAVALLSITMGTVPARAQHGGGHGGSGHGGGTGHAVAPVHGGGTFGGGAVGHGVPRLAPAPHVNAPLHTTGGRYYPSLHTTIRFGLTAGYPYYGYAWPYGYGYPFAHP